MKLDEANASEGIKNGDPNECAFGVSFEMSNFSFLFLFFSLFSKSRFAT